jgi:hypothetical protein
VLFRSKFTEQIFPTDKEQPAGITKKHRDKLVDLFQAGAGNAKVTGTKWAAFNAVTDFADHFSLVRAPEGFSIQEARMKSSTFGSGSALKQHAFDLLTAVA